MKKTISADVEDLLENSDTGHAVFCYHSFGDQIFERLVCSGHSIVHFKPGDTPGCVTIDTMGFAGWASIAFIDVDKVTEVTVDAAAGLNFFRERSQKAISNNLSKYAQPECSPAAVSGLYVFVALQTANDIVQRNAYVPMMTMLDWVVRRFAGTDHKVVVKRHPLCKDEDVQRTLRQLTQEFDHVVVSDASIHEILSGAAAVFTVNSGVGSEAMFHAKPIYCFGRSDYAFVAHQITSYEGLVEATTPIRPRRSEELFLKFFYLYRTQYQISDPRIMRARIGAVLDGRAATAAYFGP